MPENDGTDVRCFRCGEGFKHLVMAIRDEHGNYCHDWCPKTEEPKEKALCKNCGKDHNVPIIRLILSIARGLLMFPRHQLTVVLIILKLTGILPISWVWITMPSWFVMAALTLWFLLLAFIGGIMAIYEHTKK